LDISSLRERAFTEPISVSELNGYIKRLFDNDRSLTAVSVKGEISNLVLHRSGHIYFSLKDADGQIRAIMFRSSAARLKFNLENGMRVVVHGSCTVYIRDGGYQLYANSIEPDGVGALYLAYEQLKARLEGEGLFSEEFKKPIPRFAERVGIITSPTGAAVRDIINVSKRRFPGVKLYLYPALVQGEGAEESLCRALDYLDASKLCDVIIIGRGGGSIEDLWAFNSEKLARRIFFSKTPIISAVGHETDFTICDFVSDLRAPTPSAAAELAVCEVRGELRYIDTLYDRCERALLDFAKIRRERLSDFISRSPLKNPSAYFEIYKSELSALARGLGKSASELYGKMRQRMCLLSEKANALSPLKTLSRGYSVAVVNNENLKSVDKIKVDDSFKLVLSDGCLDARVVALTKNGDKKL
jgi:exodeoxyribonuclease VII large subunit